METVMQETHFFFVEKKSDEFKQKRRLSFSEHQFLLGADFDLFSHTSFQKQKTVFPKISCFSALTSTHAFTALTFIYLRKREDLFS